MRATFSVLCALVMAGAVCVAQGQEPRDKEKLPDKGDSVFVKGCLKGLILRSTETTVVDSRESLPSRSVISSKGTRTS